MYKIGIVLFLCLFALVVVWDEKIKEHDNNMNQYKTSAYSVFNEISEILMLLTEMLCPALFIWFLFQNNFSYMLYTMLFGIWAGQMNLKRYIDKRFENEKKKLI